MSMHSSVWRRSLLPLLILALCSTLIGATRQAPFQEAIALPDGFQPEGIAAGTGTTFYVGSIPTGAIYRGDVLTGAGEILVPAQEGRSAIGLKYDPRTGLLFVAGGPTGMAFVYNGETGANVAEITLSTDPSFINDVVITNDAVYFTNSFAPVIYKVPLGAGGELPDDPQVITLTLTGDYQFVAGGFNANGIAALPNGKALIIVNSTTGRLYLVDSASGEATLIDLNGGSVPAGDGILLRGKTLYVVQNQLNQVAMIKLSSDYTSGEIVDVISSPLFRVPTTIAAFGNTLYVVNARFDTPPTADTDYDVVRVPRD